MSKLEAPREEPVVLVALMRSTAAGPPLAETNSDSFSQFTSSLLLSLLLLLLPTRELIAQDRRCQCNFREKPWEAYGTRAACTAITANGKTSCNISFGGSGADSKTFSAITGQQYTVYQEQFYEIFIRYLTLIRNNDRTALTEPAFLRRALLLFMRGGYLRGNIRADLRQVDQAVVSFLNEESEQVRDVFRGVKPSYTKDVQGAKFIIERGAIRMETKDVQLLTVYLPTPQ